MQPLYSERPSVSKYAKKGIQTDLIHPLPSELLLYIFSLFNELTDICSSRRVCRQWNQLILTPDKKTGLTFFDQFQNLVIKSNIRKPTIFKLLHKDKQGNIIPPKKFIKEQRGIATFLYDKEIVGWNIKTRKEEYVIQWNENIIPTNIMNRHITFKKNNQLHIFKFNNYGSYNLNKLNGNDIRILDLNDFGIKNSKFNSFLWNGNVIIATASEVFVIDSISNKKEILLKDLQIVNVGIIDSYLIILENYSCLYIWDLNLKNYHWVADDFFYTLRTERCENQPYLILTNLQEKQFVLNIQTKSLTPISGFYNSYSQSTISQIKMKRKIPIGPKWFSNLLTLRKTKIIAEINHIFQNKITYCVLPKRLGMLSDKREIHGNYIFSSSDKYKIILYNIMQINHAPFHKTHKFFGEWFLINGKYYQLETDKNQQDAGINVIDFTSKFNLDVFKKIDKI